jgi:hypothetical protein
LFLTLGDRSQINQNFVFQIRVMIGGSESRRFSSISLPTFARVRAREVWLQAAPSAPNRPPTTE